MDGLNGLNGFSMVLKTFFSNSVFSISILLIRNTQQQIHWNCSTLEFWVPRVNVEMGHGASSALELLKQYFA